MQRALLLVSLLCAGVALASRSPSHQSDLNRIGASLGTDADMAYTFAEYKAAFGRTYAEGSEEHLLRERLFHERAAHVAAHNAQPFSWKMGINHLSDRTEEELQQLYGYKRTRKDSNSDSGARGRFGFGGWSLLQLGSSDSDGGSSCSSHQQACMDSKPGCCSGLVCGAQGTCEETKQLPAQIDWSSTLPANSVLDQGACGSCWAVAAAAAIQMQAIINSNKTFSQTISPQGMLGCTPNKQECGGTGGCDGATPELAFEWAKQHGVQTIGRQEYTASNGCPTSFLEARPTVKIGGYVRLPENKADQVMNAVVTAGPLGVAVAANDWSGYRNGVFDGCKNWVVNHAVVLVGYGTGTGEDNGKAFWNIRNSWGGSWGEKGHIRLRRHAPHGEEPCGWDMDPQKGVGCKGGPKKLWVCGECGVLSDTAYPVGTRVEPHML